MKINDIRKIATKIGIKDVKKKKGDLIREIQRAEGNFDCFGTATSGHCSEADCLWKEECLVP
ncbi:MAG: SAP domain-containing protein [Nitrospirae bacterium]|nr:SAP domain-containing protein [Nitrospirota bacterium]